MIALVAALVIGGTAQMPPQKSTSAVDMVRDVASLLSRHHVDRATLRADADRLAHVYADKVRSVRQEVAFLCDEAKIRVADMGLEKKLSLAMELWRVRASIDLLSLADPEVIKQLTSLDLPDFRDLQRRFNRAQAALGAP